MVIEKTNYKFLVLEHGFNQDGDANDICMQYIVKKINEIGIRIDFYMYGKEPKNIICKNESNNAFYFTSKYRQIMSRLESKNIDYIKLPKWKKIFPRMKLELSRLFKPHLDIFSDTTNIKEILKKIKTEHAKCRYTHMISVCCPQGSMRIAYKIKKKFPDITWIFYMLDPFEYNYVLPANQIEKRKKQFAKYTKGLDKLILTRGIHDEHKRRGYDNGHTDITIEFDLPNLAEIKTQESSSTINTNGIALLYTGAFYKDIRNPSEMLKILSELKNKNIIINILGLACEYLTKNFYELDSRIVLHGTKPHSEVKNFLAGTDFLINLGNTIPNQVPSKVFEYISCGKPILNFYSNENDTSLFYLKRYPLCFNLNVNSYSKDDIDNLEKFLSENKGKILTFAEATKDLHDCISENVCKKFVNAVLN